MLTSMVDGDPRMHTLHTASWMKEFPGVVKKGLGRLVGIKASIEIREGAQPKFCMHMPIPFALRTQVEETIRQQVEKGELKPVEQSDWAAPIVVVKTKDRGIRICADINYVQRPFHYQQ